MIGKPTKAKKYCMFKVHRLPDDVELLPENC